METCMNNNMGLDVDMEASGLAQRGKIWFAVVADNGYMYTDSVALISTALESWVMPTVTPMPSKDIAADYAAYAYASRFMWRNYRYGFTPKLPINLLPSVMFIDMEYETREGSRGVMCPVPGLPV